MDAGVRIYRGVRKAESVCTWKMRVQDEGLRV